jgi:hypothetical protein
MTVVVLNWISLDYKWTSQSGIKDTFGKFAK